MTKPNRRWWALAALTIAALAIGLDGTVLSVALPTLAADLHATTLQLQWFVAGYTLLLAIGLLPGGLLADRYGRKRVLMLALGVFAVGSLACAYAGSPGMFIAARAIAGVGASVAIPASMAVLPVLFAEDERDRAVGIWAAANFVALPIGPILGGWLLSHYWWGWVFLLNVPVVGLGVLAVATMMPESRSASRPPVDVVGILASCAGLGLLTYGIIEAGQYGWGSGAALAEMAAGLAVLVGFVAWERRIARGAPERSLVDLRLFASAEFTWGTVLAGAGIFVLFGVLFTAPQYFQAVLGTDAMGSGVRLLPIILAIAVGGVTADRIARLVGTKLTVALGFLLLCGGMLLGARTTVGSGTGFVALWTAICGLGLGIGMPIAASAALGRLDAERAGTGTAAMQTVQKIGAPLSAALLGSALNSAYRSRLDVTGLPAAAADATRKSVFGGLAVAERLGSPDLARAVRVAYVHGMDVTLVISGLLALVSIVLAVLFLPTRATERRPAAREQAESGHEVPV